MNALSYPIRPGSLTELPHFAVHEVGTGVTLRRARGQNFFVDWIEGAPGFPFVSSFDGETMLIAWGVSGARLRHDGIDTVMPGRTIAIIPAGNTEITLDGPSSLIRLSGTTGISDSLAPANAEVYAEPDPAVAQPGTPSKAIPHGIRLHSIDAIKAPVDKPRLKMLRSADLSINWVEYRGLRDRRALSPHDHADFEQGSLAICGDFVHHLRVPWGPDATQWQDDRHLQASEGSLMVIPPRVIHTTEGLGDGHHILLDVFCPPRADFLANGWIGNHAEYTVG